MVEETAGKLYELPRARTMSRCGWVVVSTAASSTAWAACRAALSSLSKQQIQLKARRRSLQHALQSLPKIMTQPACSAACKGKVFTMSTTQVGQFVQGSQKGWMGTCPHLPPHCNAPPQQVLRFSGPLLLHFERCQVH